PARSPPAATLTGGIHVVAPGETLSALGRLYGKSRLEIARVNNLAPDARLRVGQRLVVPGSRPAPVRTASRARLLKPPGAPRTPETIPAAKPHMPRPPTPPAPKMVSADPAVNARIAAPTTPDPSGETSAAPSSKEASEPASSFRWPVRGRVIAGFGPKTGG